MSRCARCIGSKVPPNTPMRGLMPARSRPPTHPAGRWPGESPGHAPEYPWASADGCGWWPRWRTLSWTLSKPFSQLSRSMPAPRRVAMVSADTPRSCAHWPGCAPGRWRACRSRGGPPRRFLRRAAVHRHHQAAHHRTPLVGDQGAGVLISLASPFSGPCLRQQLDQPGVHARQHGQVLSGNLSVSNFRIHGY